MTIEQAKSELMQIYGALAPNKQIAIDTLIKASIKSQERDSTTKASITMMRLDYEARLRADMVEMLDIVRAEIAELSHYYPMGRDYKIAIARCLEVIDKDKDRIRGGRCE